MIRVYIHKILMCLLTTLSTSFLFIVLHASPEEDQEGNKGKFDYNGLEMLKIENPHNYYNKYSSSEYLEFAYHNKSIAMLDTFFMTNQMLNEVFDEKNQNLKPTIEQEVYKIFKFVYNPLKIREYQEPFSEKNGNDNKNSELYENSKYILVQNKINLVLIDNVKQKPKKCHRTRVVYKDTTYEQEISFYQINAFIPDIHFDGKRIIHCDESLIEIINNFFGIFLKDNMLETSSFSEIELENRLNFINQMIKVNLNHGGDSYNILSYPIIPTVYLNINLKEARIIFLNVSAPYYVDLEKKDGKWVIISVNRGPVY